jgi:hypothetical protein
MLKEAAYRIATFNDAHTHRRQIPDCSRPVDRDGSIEVATIEVLSASSNGPSRSGVARSSVIVLQVSRSEAPLCSTRD